MSEDFVSLPKVELHSHLDCSLSYPTVARLGLDLSLAEYRERFVAPARCKDLTEFLACVDPAVSVLQTKKALEIAVDGMLVQQRDDNVVYAEMRFAPHLHQADGLALEEIVETVLQTMHNSAQAHGVACGLILCTLRHFSVAQGLEVAQLVRKYANQGVVALDLAADEANFPIAPHVAAFRSVSDAGLHATAHAGESKGAASVAETLELLRVQRIGHGVRAIEDPDVVETLVSNGIHLEVCPTCNIQTGIFPDLAQHSLAALRSSGVLLSLNTDARATTGVSLSEEYANVSRVFGWSASEMLEFSQNALHASFASDEVKRKVQRQLDTYAGD